MEITHAINSPHVGGEAREAELLHTVRSCLLSTETHLGEKMVSEIVSDFLFGVS